MWLWRDWRVERADLRFWELWEVDGVFSAKHKCSEMDVRRILIIF